MGGKFWGADRKNRRAKQNNSHNQVRCTFLLPCRIGLRFVPYCCIRQASSLLLELREREIQRASGQRALWVWDEQRGSRDPTKLKPTETEADRRPTVTSSCVTPRGLLNYWQQFCNHLTLRLIEQKRKNMCCEAKDDDIAIDATQLESNDPREVADIDIYVSTSPRSSGGPPDWSAPSLGCSSPRNAGGFLRLVSWVRSSGGRFHWLVCVDLFHILICFFILYF